MPLDPLPWWCTLLTGLVRAVCGLTITLLAVSVWLPVVGLCALAWLPHALGRLTDPGPDVPADW